MIVRGANGSYEFIDFREKAPAAAFQVGFETSFEYDTLSFVSRFSRTRHANGFAAAETSSCESRLSFV